MKRFLILAVLLAGCAGVTTPPPPGFSVSTKTLTPATLSRSYSATIQAVGGTPPYVWTVVSGTLPAGIVLESNGVLKGTPTQQGVFQFTVEVKDSSTKTAMVEIKSPN